MRPTYAARDRSSAGGYDRPIADPGKIIKRLAAEHPDGLWAQEALGVFLDAEGIGPAEDMPDPGSKTASPTPQKDPEVAKRVWARVSLDNLTGVRETEYEPVALGVPADEVEALRAKIDEFNNAWIQAFGNHQPHSHGKKAA